MPNQDTNPETTIIAWPLLKNHNLRAKARKSQSRKALTKLIHALADQVLYVQPQIEEKCVKLSLPNPISVRAETAGIEDLDELRSVALNMITTLETAQAHGLRVPILEPAASAPLRKAQ
jgi:hypothetical protein